MAGRLRLLDAAPGLGERRAQGAHHAAHRARGQAELRGPGGLGGAARGRREAQEQPGGLRAKALPALEHLEEVLDFKIIYSVLSSEIY